MGPLLSVIIPVYNTECELLDDCIASIIDQRWEPLEVLIIDDGSESVTANHCDVLSRRHAFVSTMHVKNCGAAAARNYGLDSCAGDLVTFVDSDDTLVQGFFADAITEIEGHDLDMVCGGYVFDDGMHRKTMFEHSPWEGRSVVAQGDERLLVSERYCGGVYLKEQPEWARVVSVGGCATVFSRQAIGEVRFPVGLRVHEDSIFVSEVIERSERVGLCFRPWYVYRKVEASASHSISAFLNGEGLSDALDKCSAVKRKPWLRDVCIVTRLTIFVANAVRMNGHKALRLLKSELDKPYARTALTAVDVNSLDISWKKRVKILCMKNQKYRTLIALQILQNAIMSE